MWFVIFVNKSERPFLGFARHEFVAEGVHLNLQALSLNIAVHANALVINLIVVNTVEMNVEISAWSVGQLDCEIVDTLLHLYPALFLHLVARSSEVVDVGFGNIGADGNVSHILIVNTLSVAWHP